MVEITSGVIGAGAGAIAAGIAIIAKMPEEIVSVSSTVASAVSGYIASQMMGGSILSDGDYIVECTFAEVQDIQGGWYDTMVTESYYRKGMNGQGEEVLLFEKSVDSFYLRSKEGFLHGM